MSAVARAGASQPFPAQVHAVYRIEFNGFNVGTFEFVSSVQGSNYTLSGDAKLSALLGAFRSVRDSQFSARITGAVVLSVGYAACGLSYLMFGYEFHTTLYVCLAAIVLGFCRDAPVMRAPAVNPAG